MPKFSVVMSSYNYGHFISKAIQGVLDQTFKDFEFIVADDGSTDNTAEVVASFPSVRYFRTAENKGPAAATNYGVTKSQGKYLAFVGADDILLPRALELAGGVMDAHPEVGLVYGQAYMMDENEKVYRIRGSSFLRQSAVIDGIQQIKELLFENRIIPTFMVTRQCFDAIGGFDEELRAIAEDRHFCIRAAKKFSIGYIAEPIVRYRLHLNQMHRRVDPKQAEVAFKLVLNEVYGDPNFAPHFQYLKRSAYSRNYRRIADYGLYYGRDLKLARRYLGKAVMAYPEILLSRDGLPIAYNYAVSLLPKGAWQALQAMKNRFGDPVKRLRD
jgi:glycosyltransferase involved in cell wall biosynthesis